MSKQRSSIFTLASSLFAQSVRSCVQVDLESIANTNGVITDNQTSEDELFVWLGVSADVMITWQNSITPYEQQDFDPGVITLPCFQEGVLWIEMEEQDVFQIDKAQIAMSCHNLALGKNKIIIHIEEDNAGIDNSAKIVDTPTTTSFNFGD